MCDETFAGDGDYVEHLRDVHDLVDDEGLDDGGPDPEVLAAAAAALARAAAADQPVVDERAGRRRASQVFRAAAVLLVAAAAGWWVVSAGGEPTVVGIRRPASMPGVEVLGTVALPPTTSIAEAAPTTVAPPAPTPAGPSTTQAPVATSTTTVPPATTTTTIQRGTARAGEATVVSCTEDSGARTLVYSYVLSGTTEDGLHEATVTAPASNGPIVVSAVMATEPGGATVVVPLLPGPVVCG